MHLPTLRNLHYLVQLHKHQHFGKAAQACYVSQSTLSTGIRHLEDLFEVQLVERDNKSILFTTAGLAVVQEAREILSKVEHLVDVVTSQQKPFNGKLKLGCIPTIAPFLLPKLIEFIKSDYEDLHLIISEATTAQILDKLYSGQLDLVLMALPYQTPGLQRAIFAQDGFQFAYHKNRAFKKNRPIDFDDLNSESILLLEDGHCLRDHAIAACHLTKQAIINTYSVASLHTLVHMVNHDLGVTFLPDMAIDSGILKNTQIEIRKLKWADAYREIGLVWRDTSSHSNEFKELAKRLESII